MLLDVGPRVYKQDSGVATLSLSPLNDRALVVRRILIDKVSAGDVWRVKVQGKELAAFDIQQTGNQQPLAGPYSGYPKNNDIFDIVAAVYGEQLIYPVPLGQTLTVASDGGATADISLIYTEHQPAELSPGMVNHPQSNRILTLLAGYRAADVTAAGENALDTQVGPSWFPNIFVDGTLPPNWQFRVLCMFLEGAGVNTYDSSSDALSITEYLAVIKNGQRMYTRDDLGGIPVIGSAAATGSANTVIQTEQTANPPIQESDQFDWSNTDPPLILGGGDNYRFRLAVSGDVTGGADYSGARQLFLCDVRNPGM